MVPSTCNTASTTQIMHISLLNSSGHTHRCRHFIGTLTDHNARLAEICVLVKLHTAGLAPATLMPVSLAFVTFCQLAWRSHVRNFYPKFLWHDTTRVVLQNEVVAVGNFGGYATKRIDYIESVNSRLAHTTRRVTRWTNSDQRQRWIAAACLDIEQRSLNPIPQDSNWEAFLRTLDRHGKTKNQYNGRTLQLHPNFH